MEALGRIVDDNPVPLLSEANGDVLAARRVARSLLATSEHLFPDTALPVLVLTAMLLHCAIMNGEAAFRLDVISLLRRLSGEYLRVSDLLRSPVQFVRYAALEVQSLRTVDRKALCHRLVSALHAQA